MDVLVYEPPRYGPTLWEIGIPDRSAEEFYVPDPYPNLINRLYKNNSTEKLVTYTICKYTLLL
jgi:rhamnogalacturonan endolyase